MHKFINPLRAKKRRSDFLRASLFLLTFPVPGLAQGLAIPSNFHPGVLSFILIGTGLHCVNLVNLSK